MERWHEQFNGPGPGPGPGPEPVGGRLARWRQGFRQHVLRDSLIVAAAGAAVTTPMVTAMTERVVAEDPPPIYPGTDCGDRNPQATTCGEDAGSHRPTEATPATRHVEVCAVPGADPDRQATWQRCCVEATHDTDFALR